MSLNAVISPGRGWWHGSQRLSLALLHWSGAGSDDFTIHTKIANAQWRPEARAEERQRFGKNEFFFFFFLRDVWKVLMAT